MLRIWDLAGFHAFRSPGPLSFKSWKKRTLSTKMESSKWDSPAPVSNALLAHLPPSDKGSAGDRVSHMGDRSHHRAISSHEFFSSSLRNLEGYRKCLCYVFGSHEPRFKFQLNEKLRKNCNFCKPSKIIDSYRYS